MRLYPDGDAIDVRLDEVGHPAAFRWQGLVHRITSIEEVREPQIDWWSATGEIHRLYYLVTTNRGLIAEIYRDLVDDGWFVSRTLD